MHRNCPTITGGARFGKHARKKLRIAVIGAGVAGTTTAWELTRTGHQVTVFDKATGIAEGASFASPGWIGNAGLTGWDNASPQWPSIGPRGITASPGWWRQAGGFRWLALKKRLSTDAAKSDECAIGHKLAALTSNRVRESLSQPGNEIERSQGIMMLFRTSADLGAYKSGLLRLAEQQVKVHELDAQAAKKLEPGLSDELLPYQRWWLPEDEIINGRQWLSLLKADALRNGCIFQMSEQVTAIKPNGELTTLHIRSTQPYTLHFDMVIVCAGHQANDLLAPIGISNLPLLNMNQCVLSAQVREHHFAPVSGVFDASRRISISRTGQRLRVSSSQGIWPGQNPQPIFDQLYQVLNDWFPGSASLHGVQSCTQTWQTTNSFTPDGLPVVGPTSFPNIWLNTGYGSTGWTHAPGVANLLAVHFAHHKHPDSSELLLKLSSDRFE